MCEKLLIENTSYGIKITMNGHICIDDLRSWYEKISDNIKLSKKFSVIFDLKDVSPICAEAARYLNIGRVFLIGKGMRRLAIVYDSSAKLVEVMRAFDSDFNCEERYFCTKSYSDWEEKSVKWANDGTD